MIIGGYAKQGYGVEAYKLFLQMQQEEVTPDEVIYMSILNPCAGKGAQNWVKEVYIHALKAMLALHLRAKSRGLEDA
jgi:pentatricopeptide repeat protein